MKDKLKKGTLTLLLTVTLALMTVPCVMAAPATPEVWTTDSSGNTKGMFVMEDDDVFVMGSGFPPSTDVTIHVYDLGDGYEDTIIATSSVTTDSDGSIPVTLVWSKPLHPTYKLTGWEEYYIWVDTNQNGQRDDGDVFQAFIVVGRSLLGPWRGPRSESNLEPNPGPVVPELGTMILMMAMFGALATAYLARKRIH